MLIQASDSVQAFLSLNSLGSFKHISSHMSGCALLFIRGWEVHHFPVNPHLWNPLFAKTNTLALCGLSKFVFYHRIGSSLPLVPVAERRPLQLWLTPTIANIVSALWPEGGSNEPTTARDIRMRQKYTKFKNLLGQAMQRWDLYFSNSFF